MSAIESEEVIPSTPVSAVVAQFKDKFKTNTKRNEHMCILTVLLHNWM
jgi:hypothetical protein